jgi:hypothetical protein
MLRDCRADIALDAHELCRWRLPYAEGRVSRQDKHRAQWRWYNGSPKGWRRERGRNQTSQRAVYMRARGRARTAAIQAGRLSDTAYQTHSGRWRV